MAFFVHVLGGTALQFLVGMLWYGPIAGSTFLQLAYRDGKLPPNLNLNVCHAVTIIAAFGLNNFLKLCVGAMDVHSITGAVVVALTLWAFSLLLQLPHVFYENRSLILLSVHELGHLVTLLLLCSFYSYLAVTSVK